VQVEVLLWVQVEALLWVRVEVLHWVRVEVLHWVLVVVLLSVRYSSRDLLQVDHFFGLEERNVEGLRLQLQDYA